MLWKFSSVLERKSFEGNEIESEGDTQKYFRPDPH
jgi:hypothetical protein